MNEKSSKGYKIPSSHDERDKGGMILPETVMEGSKRSIIVGQNQLRETPRGLDNRRTINTHNSSLGIFDDDELKRSSINHQPRQAYFQGMKPPTLEGRNEKGSCDIDAGSMIDSLKKSTNLSIGSESLKALNKYEEVPPKLVQPPTLTESCPGCLTLKSLIRSFEKDLTSTLERIDQLINQNRLNRGFGDFSVRVQNIEFQLEKEKSRKDKFYRGKNEGLAHNFKLGIFVSRMEAVCKGLVERLVASGLQKNFPKEYDNDVHEMSIDHGICVNLKAEHLNKERIGSLDGLPGRPGFPKVGGDNINLANPFPMQSMKSLRSFKFEEIYKKELIVSKISFRHLPDLRQESIVRQIIEQSIGNVDLISYLRENIVGRYNIIETPWGSRLRVYADFTASGQDLRLTDSVMESIKENYSNTHTEASHDGKIMNTLLKEAELVIMKLCNANPVTHSLVGAGSGCTGAIEFVQKILGTYIPPKTSQVLSEIITFKKIKDKLRKKKNLPMVIISGYEHHSNEITWRNQLCDVERVPFNEAGFMDLEILDSMLKKLSKAYNRIICSFSAGSNVTGIRTDIPETTRVVKKYNGLLFFDYAGIAPYVKIDMNNEIDGIFISPHKFLGGPGTPGIAIIKNRIYPHELDPTHGGGGTVDYVNPDNVVYSRSITEREKSGTPAILQTIKASIAFSIKEMIFPFIHSREQDILNRFFNSFRLNPTLTILGPDDPKNRVNIISFNVAHPSPSGDRFLHPSYIVRLLSDLFGIQARSGCSCASTYGHELLGIDMKTSNRVLKWVETLESRIPSLAGIKDGWARINLHYSMNDDDVDYIITAVKFIADKGPLFLPFYLFDPRNGTWSHVNEWSGGKPKCLNFNLLLAEKSYAKDEKARSMLMKDHVDQANSLAKNLSGSFPLDPLLLWGDAARFYVAKGNVKFSELIEQKSSMLSQRK
jgi:selenocysteine lyase/cysteine desulfurase